MLYAIRNDAHLGLSPPGARVTAGRHDPVSGRVRVAYSGHTIVRVAGEFIEGKSYLARIPYPQIHVNR